MTKEKLLQIINEAKAEDITELDLSGKQITELPPEIGQLKGLRSLSLKRNQLAKLPKEIFELVNLERLNLFHNRLVELPKEIVRLTNLHALLLDGNLLTTLPEEIAQLEGIREVYIAENQLREFPKGIIQSKNVTVLSLFDNQLTELPREITQLTNLDILYLDEKQLKDSAEVLITLKENNLAIHIMDERLGRSGRIPPEILARSKSAKELLDYYFQVKQGEGRELNEAKVLVVGQGSVGKTSLIKRLITGKYNPKENKTEGIDINKWVVSVNDRDVQLNVWDFGGQEIMHATHQFFLTKRSLYILVLDSRIGAEENRVDYWLEKIKSFGGDSPVIVVGNKSDQHPLDINQTGLSKKYPNIKAFYEVSCESEKNVDKLKEGLIQAVGKLDGVHDILPASWFGIKEELEKIDDNYIPYDRYLKICTQKEVADEENQSRLIKLLHDLGIILNFSEEEWMHDTNVLNPEWVTQGVYRIINSRELFKTKGELTKKMLGKILDTRDYPKGKHLFVVRMMQKFELCFDIVPNEKFLVPDLLAEEELDTGDWTDSLKFEYHYKVFFNSIITRFIVKMHDYISKQTYWRTGVVLVYKVGDEVKNRALIKADSADRKILIYIEGSKDTRREFLSRIRATFEQIHGSFAREFVVENIFEKVPIPDHPDIVVDYKHLLSMEEIGEKDFIPEGLKERVSVKELLKGIKSTNNQGINQQIDALKAKNLTDEEFEVFNEGTKLQTTSENIASLFELIVGLLIIGFAVYKGNEIIEWWKTGDLEPITFILFTLIVLGAIFVFFAFFRKTLSLEWIDGKLVNLIKRLTFRAKGKELKTYHDLCQKLDESKKELAQK